MARRKLIMDSALELFTKNGIKNTSVQQITDHSNISKGAFYLVFKSKNELVVALIDRFMMEYNSRVNQLVSETEQDKLLEQFFLYSCNFFIKHVSFSHIYIKEQLHEVNDTMIKRLRNFDHMINESVYNLVDRLYKEKSTNEKYELVFIIKAFIQLFQMHSIQIEEGLSIEAFVQSFVDKIEVIAKYSKTTFVTNHLILARQFLTSKIDKELLIEKIANVLNEADDKLIIDSLQLLINHLNKQNLSAAIVQGLIHNLSTDDSCLEVTFLLKEYFQQSNS